MVIFTYRNLRLICSILNGFLKGLKLACVTEAGGEVGTIPTKGIFCKVQNDI